jgi:transcriptional regulator with XRE-family HTH domain
MDARREARCHRCGTRLAHDNPDDYCTPCRVGNRGRLATPPVVSAELWDNQAMRMAFASRHMGRVIRAYRCHPFHGRRPLPQDVVASWMGVTQGQLSRIENGPIIVHLDRLMHWARVFTIPSSCLWFTLPEDGQAVAPAVELLPAVTKLSGSIALSYGDVSLWWGPADTVEIVSQFTRRDLTLDRREVDRLLAGVVVGSALLEPLEHWLSGATEKPRADRAGSVGYQEVEQIEKAAQIFRDWDDQFGGGLRRKAVVGQLSEVADLLRDSHPFKIQRRLFGAMAQLSELRP